MDKNRSRASVATEGAAAVCDALKRHESYSPSRRPNANAAFRLDVQPPWPPAFVAWLTGYVITAQRWGRRDDLSRITADLIQRLARNGRLRHVLSVNDICRHLADLGIWRPDYRPFIEILWRAYERACERP